MAAGAALAVGGPASAVPPPAGGPLAVGPPGARSESFATDIDDRGRIIGLDR